MSESEPESGRVWVSDEHEIQRLRTELHRLSESRRGQRERADALEEQNARLRAALSEILESFTEPEDDNAILRRARAALQ